MKPHVILVFALAFGLFAFASCRALSVWGSTAVGGAAGSLLGPGGAAAGAVAGNIGGDKLADALGADPVMTVSQAEKIIYRDREVPVPFVPSIIKWGLIALCGWLVIRFRAAIVPFFGSLLTGGFLASAKTAIGVALGGKFSQAAKAATAMHVDARRRRKSPIGQVKQEVKEHPL